MNIEYYYYCGVPSSVAELANGVTRYAAHTHAVRVKSLKHALFQASDRTHTNVHRLTCDRIG